MKSIQTVIRRLVPGLVLGFVVFVGLALLGDLREVSQLLLRFKWQYLALALVFTLFNYGLRFLKWHYYLRQLGVNQLTVGQSLRLFVAGFPLAVTPGKVGEVLKGVWLNKLTGLPVARGVSVVLAERISDGLAVMLLSFVGVIAYPQYWPVFAAILAMLLTIIVLSQIRPAALFLLDLFEKLPLIKRTASGLREFYEGSFALFKPGATFVAVLLGTISWLGEGIGFFFILVGLGLEPSLQLMGAAVFVLAFSTAVGGASTLPGGLGAAEATIAILLALALQRSEPAIISAATLLIRLATLWFGVALGLITWSFSPDLLGFQLEKELSSQPDQA
jgi:glycosyltransferase 2 family protein